MKDLLELLEGSIVGNETLPRNHRREFVSLNVVFAPRKLRHSALLILFTFIEFVLAPRKSVLTEYDLQA